MPSDIDQYIEFYNDADKAAVAFKTALSELQSAIAYVASDPQALMAPGGTWPTQDQLRELYVAARQKTEMARAKHQSFAKEHREHVKSPATIGQASQSGPKGRRVIL